MSLILAIGLEPVLEESILGESPAKAPWYYLKLYVYQVLSVLSQLSAYCDWNVTNLLIDSESLVDGVYYPFLSLLEMHRTLSKSFLFNCLFNP